MKLNFLIGLMISFYGAFTLFCLVLLILKIKERINNKPKDDNDLEKFDKY